MPRTLLARKSRILRTITFAGGPALGARALWREVVGNFTGSGLHYLKSARFRFGNGSAPSITTHAEPPSPTSGSQRSLFRQPRDDALVRPALRLPLGAI